MSPRAQRWLIGAAAGLAAFVAGLHHADARPRLPWCGIFMSKRIYGRVIAEPRRNLMRAIEWRHEGRPANGPCPGCIGVQRHHVFQVIRVVGPGRVLAISGNDNNAVRTRVRSTNSVIAWRSL